uniref:LacI family DNA-binding transcriptional regulator n=1 Tax=Nocardioides sp. Root682 TaxID=1736586 RepID=UPI001F24EEDE|nr:substrate-binding domain-containing protein [Nocardioides sp. Root682]
MVWHNVAELHRDYARAFEGSDVVPSPDLVAEVSDFTVEAGRNATARLLQLPDPPSAIFAGGSNLALGAMAEAKARGLRVPQDLAIVGYTDSPLASLVDPALTVVEVPARQIGLQAMHVLSELIQGKRPRRRRTVLATKLIVRDSCGSHPLG